MVLGLSSGALFASENLPDVIRFNRDIRPILSNNCFLCHGPDKGRRKGDLRLDLPAEAAEVIAPGKPTQSELWARITSSDPDERMPAKGSKKELNPHQIALINTTACLSHQSCFPPYGYLEPSLLLSNALLPPAQKSPHQYPAAIDAAKHLALGRRAS